LKDSASHASIWQKALQKKNQLIQERKNLASVDRSQIIRQELADFNRIQSLSQKRDMLVRSIEKLV